MKNKKETKWVQRLERENGENILMVKVGKKFDESLNKISAKSRAGARYVTGTSHIHSNIETAPGPHPARLGEEEDLYIFGTQTYMKDISLRILQLIQ